MNLPAKSRNRRHAAEQMVTRLIPDGPPMALYDIGVGPYEEFATLKQHWPHLLLFGCEPDPFEFGNVKDQFHALGGMIADVAIARETGRRKFHVCDPGQGGGSLHDLGSNGRGVVMVETWSLDLFDRWAGRQDGILLWMDIEGAELEALQGGTELLRSGRVHWLNIETRHQDDRPGKPCTKDITDLLDAYGYAAVSRYNVQGAYVEAPGDMVYFRKGVEPLIPARAGLPLTLEAWQQWKQ